MEKIRTLKIQDEKYPEILRQIDNPPQCIYVLGNIEILNKPSIAIVGSRQPSDYGKNIAKYLSYNISQNDINIVSGIAKGIDSYAHIGCLQANGKTIAVEGCGLDTIYPKENQKLANEIIEKGGTIISEYPLGTKPCKENFPMRNRIISGLSLGIIVVEAKEKSGALITADCALEQGRDVFSVPGNITSKNSIGTNNLIKEGAIPIINYKDIIDFYNNSYNKFITSANKIKGKI